MKAITLWQPWATLVAIGAKKYETRSWAISYRGPLAIHAAKAGPHEIVRIARKEPFRQTLAEAGYPSFSSLPRGGIIALCTLIDCISTERFLEGVTYLEPALGFLESAFGDFSARRWVWVLKEVNKLGKPIPCAGHQGLWDWDEKLPADLHLAEQ